MEGTLLCYEKISDVIYRVQNLQKQKDMQVVHFLKPCPKNIWLKRSKQLVTQPSHSRNAAPLTQPTTLPSDIKLVEEDDEITPTMSLGDTDRNPWPTEDISYISNPHLSCKYAH